MASLEVRQSETVQALVASLQTESRPFRTTIETYYKMAAAGLLEPNKRYELIHGVVLEMHAISPQHGYRVKRLGDMLSTCLQPSAEVFTQHPVQIGDDSEPEPDIIVVKPPLEQYKARHPRPEDILLVIEVANTTLQTDRTLKLHLYASAGIPEYWIYNLQKNQLEIHRDPDPDEARYREMRTLSEGEAATFVGNCEITWWT